MDKMNNNVVLRVLTAIVGSVVLFYSVLSFITALDFFSVMSNWSSWRRLVFIYPLWAAYCLAALGVVRFIAIVGIWMSSRKAAILYLLVVALTSMLWLVLDRTSPIVLGLIEVFCLGLVVLPRWSKMTWRVGR